MEDVTFHRGPARRPLPRVADPLLQWATGLQTSDRRIYAGWLAEAGRNPELDSAMTAAGFDRVTIRHGSGNLVTHWAVETANLFVITEGIQSIAEMQHTAERFGIAFGWRTLTGGRQQSQLRFRAFVHELLAIGFMEPVLVTVKGTLTGDVITALMRQYDVLDGLDALRIKEGKAALQAPFYACSIPLGPGQEVARGTVQTKEIVPIVADVPQVIDKEYVLAHWPRKPWVAQIEQLLDATIAWSVATSQLIASGEDQPAALPAEEEVVPVAANGSGRTATRPTPRRPAEEDLL